MAPPTPSPSASGPPTRPRPPPLPATPFFLDLKAFDGLLTMSHPLPIGLAKTVTRLNRSINDETYTFFWGFKPILEFAKSGWVLLHNPKTNSSTEYHNVLKFLFDRLRHPLSSNFDQSKRSWGRLIPLLSDRTLSIYTLKLTEAGLPNFEVPTFNPKTYYLHDSSLPIAFHPFTGHSLFDPYNTASR